MTDFPSLSPSDALSLLDAPEEREAFVSFILSFHRRWGRSFPWRETCDCYRVLLSEVMLQQTPTGRVEGKYREFLELWPSFSALASAPFDEVLFHWRGLGYNRRALALHRSARATEAWNWTIPNDRALIMSLPGVGEATAGAIECFCYRKKAIYLETNIRRAMIHAFHKGEEGVRDDELKSDLASLLPFVDDSKVWYYALMDWGVLLGRLAPGLNRRSASYHRQSAFEGSARQARGQIVHMLSESGERRRETILRTLPFGRESVCSALDSLVRDNLLEEEDGLYRVRR